MIKKINNMMVLCILAIFVGCISLTATEVSAVPPNLVIVKGSLNTTPSNGPAGQGINIDVVGGAALPFGKIKRYTVTITPGPLSSAPAGMDRVELYVGVLSGASAYDVRVLRQDFPYPGITVLPYTGTNSFIKVFRGADGLGAVTVRFNAFVEVEP
jgi:hypothetical protein